MERRVGSHLIDFNISTEARSFEPHNSWDQPMLEQLFHVSVEGLPQ